MKLYVPFTGDTAMDDEQFVITMQFKIREKVNRKIEKMLIIPDRYRLRVLINKFIEDENLSVLGTPGDIAIMTLDELEEMFRVEFEYWVIRNKRPVSMIKTPDDYFKIILGHRSDHGRYDTFKDAENFLKNTYIPVDRVSIAGSPYEMEANIVTLFKIK